MPTGIYKRTDEHRRHMSEAVVGENNPFYGKTHTKEFRERMREVHYKGKTNYRGLHLWVTRHKGKPEICVECGKTEGRIEWANISGLYKRDLGDYQSMCKKCHIAMDKANPPTVKLKSRYLEIT